MMSGVILEELRVAGIAIISGACITIVYDCLRIFRRVVPHGNVWIGIEDFFFWIWTALWVFSVLYRENDGSLRMYTILAMVLGMFLYHQTISEFLVCFLSKLFKQILWIVLFPLKKVKIYIIFFGKKLKKLVSPIIMKLRWRNIDGNQDESKKKT